MSSKPRVAVLRVAPDRILDDIERLMELAEFRRALDPSRPTILKDNISWHFPFPGANTTPWQLEGVARALRGAGYRDLTCVQNKTVVTNAFKGEDLNHYLPIFERLSIPVRYNFRPNDMTWVEYKPKAKMLVLDRIFPEGIRIPDYFSGKNIVHLPTVKCVGGDARVVLEDGVTLTIRELFERERGTGRDEVRVDGDLRCATKVSLLAMDGNGRIRPHRATWLWRTRPSGRRVLHLRTWAGRTLTATEDHPIWTPKGWQAIGALQKGAEIAIAGAIHLEAEREAAPSGGATPKSARARAAVTVAEPRMRASAELGWDKVQELRAIPSENLDLYDVTVPTAECFVANGLVVHNCHIYTTTTGAMKNAFGGLLNTKRHYTHSWIHQTLVDLLAIQKEIHSGLFAVMDGTTAGNGPGPRTMFPEIKNVMLASADQVAIDAVAAKLMGFDPMTLDYIRLAHEAGLGVGRPSEIELVGDDVGDENWHFHVGDNGASRVGDFLWFGPLKSIQKLFFHTPLVNLFILGSEAYHDFYRWPARDRATFDHWRTTTEWGQLFDRYASGAPVFATSDR